uniref:NfeD family protein n=1 Tax=candidate division WOR-3 bacterium TaxID=2052148 RepID=A0A7C3N7G9_UNCW3
MSPSLFWLLVAVILFIIEVLTPFFLFVLFSFAALVSSLFSIFFPKLIFVQVIIFVFLSILFAFTIRKVFIKYLSKDDKGGLKTNVDSYIGRSCKVITTIDNSQDTGICEIDGVRWRAYSDDGTVIQKDSFVTIKRVEGAHLYVVKN